MFFKTTESENVLPSDVVKQEMDVLRMATGFSLPELRAFPEGLYKIKGGRGVPLDQESPDRLKTSVTPISSEMIKVIAKKTQEARVYFIKEAVIWKYPCPGLLPLIISYVQ